MLRFRLGEACAEEYRAYEAGPKLAKTKNTLLRKSTISIKYTRTYEQYLMKLLIDIESVENVEIITQLHSQLGFIYDTLTSFADYYCTDSYEGHILSNELEYSPQILHANRKECQNIITALVHLSTHLQSLLKQVSEISVLDIYIRFAYVVCFFLWRSRSRICSSNIQFKTCSIRKDEVT